MIKIMKIKLLISDRDIEKLKKDGILLTDDNSIELKYVNDSE